MSGVRDSADATVLALGELRIGDAVLLSTYPSDGEQVSTARRHLDLSTSAPDKEAILAELWSALNPRFRVAAVVFAPLDGVQGPTVHA